MNVDTVNRLSTEKKLHIYHKYYKYYLYKNCIDLE